MSQRYRSVSRVSCISMRVKYYNVRRDGGIGLRLARCRSGRVGFQMHRACSKRMAFSNLFVAQFDT